MMKLRIPLQVFFVDPLKGDALVPATISLTVGVSGSGSGVWLDDLDVDSERRSEEEDISPTRLDKSLGFEKSFCLPSAQWAHARVHVLVLRQTGGADPVLLGGKEGTIPVGGFLSYEWCLRLETYGELLARILVTDLDTLTRITQRTGPVSRLVWRDTYSSVPHHVGVALLAREWSARKGAVAS